MKNNTAIAVSAGLVLAVAGVSGATYVTAAQRPPGEVPPSTEIIVEFVDEQGNVVPIEATVVTSDEKSTTAASASDSDEEEYRDDDRYENDDRHEDDHGYEDDDGYDDDDGSPTMTERSAGRPTGAARIIALGASVAAGIGIIGAMATGAAADQQPAPSPTATRVLVIQQPAPTTTPVVGARTTDAPIDAVAPIESTPPMLPPAPPPAPPPPPVAVVIESVAPEPVTVTEGS